MKKWVHDAIICGDAILVHLCRGPVCCVYRLCPAMFDLVKTIEDGEDVPNFSENSDEEDEVRIVFCGCCRIFISCGFHYYSGLKFITRLAMEPCALRLLLLFHL
jgi:hypothetical protein